jgi:excisionase family DNA binding protein
MTRADRRDADGALWSTRQVAARLRVSEATIKRWADEGLIPCYRTPGGHRKFRPADVGAFASSHDFGPSSSALAEPSRRGNALELMLKGEVARLFDFARRWIEGGLPLDRLLDEVFASGLQEVGERWACGALSVAEEHFATSTVLEVLSRITPLVSGSPTRGLAISACVAGERHDVASRMVAVVLASRKYRTLTAGADTPADSLVKVIEEQHPRVVAVSASVATADRETVLGDVLKIARAAEKTGARLIVGGNGVTGQTPLPAGVLRAANMRALAAALPL